jgi:rod shape-determining protein MreD
MSLRENGIWLLVVLAAVVLETAWPEALRPAGVAPRFVLIAVVYFALNFGEERAMGAGAFGGLLEDVVRGATLGHHVLCNVLVGYVVGRLGRRLIASHPAVKAGFVFLAATAHGVLFEFIHNIQEPQVSALRLIVVSVIPAAFYSAMVTPLIFIPLDRCFQRSLRILRGESQP